MAIPQIVATEDAEWTNPDTGNVEYLAVNKGTTENPDYHWIRKATGTVVRVLTESENVRVTDAITAANLANSKITKVTFGQLLTTTALVPVCVDPDPAIDAVFGGGYVQRGLNLYKVEGYCANTNTPTEILDGVDTGLGTVNPDPPTIPIGNNGITVTGSLINLPNDGTYRIQTVVSATILYEGTGGSSIIVPDGTYTVFNLTTGLTTNNVVVNNIGNSGSNSSATTPTPTTYTAQFYDAYVWAWRDNGTGVPIQTVTKKNTVNNFSGQGYIEFTNDVAAPDTAVAFYNINDDTVARKVWGRVQVTQTGDVIKSQGSTTALIENTVTGDANTWQWIPFDSGVNAYNAQLKISSQFDGAKVDAFILTDLANTDVPNGPEGFSGANYVRITGSGTGDPNVGTGGGTPGVDGTITTGAFKFFDAAAALTSVLAGSAVPAQTITAATAATGYGDTGYLLWTNNATYAGRSTAIFDLTGNVPTSNQIIWARCQVVISGDNISARSPGGPESILSVQLAVDTWHWVKLPLVALGNVNSIYFRSEKTGLKLDSFILTDTTNADTPTGVNGFIGA